MWTHLSIRLLGLLMILVALPHDASGQRQGDAHAQSAFTPGEIWLDTKGKPINSHGGGMLYHDQTHYWYGENKVGRSWVPEANRDWDGYRVDVTGSGMATSESQDLFPDVRNPKSIRVINEQCLIRSEDDYSLVIVSGIVQRLKADGHSNREIARRVGVREMAIRKMLRRLGRRELSAESRTPDMGVFENVRFFLRRALGSRSAGEAATPGKPVTVWLSSSQSAAIARVLCGELNGAKVTRRSCCP